MSNVDRFLDLTIGFEDLFNHGRQATTFPPHNIVKLSDNEFQIELAVAGFSRDEISITVKESKLTIASKKVEDGVTREYIHRGIALRGFTKEFILQEFIEVRKADIINGLLVIDLVRNVPEAKRERVINIG